MGCVVVPGMLMAIGLVSGKQQILAPCRINTLQSIAKNLPQVIMLATLTCVPNVVQIRPQGGGRHCKWVKYNKFKNIFIHPFW